MSRFTWRLDDGSWGDGDDEQPAADAMTRALLASPPGTRGVLRERLGLRMGGVVARARLDATSHELVWGPG